MGKEEFEARVRIGDFHKEKHLMIEIKDVDDGQYGLGTAYPIKNLSNEELIQKFVEELKHIDDLGYIIHYQ